MGDKMGRVKQLKRVCDQCHMNFWVYTENSYCERCSYLHYYQYWRGELHEPKSATQRSLFKEIMQETRWFLLLCTIGTAIGGPLYAGETQEKYQGTASYYDSTSACRYNKEPKCPTASGKSLYQLEKEGVRYAASYEFPMGSTLEVCRKSDERVCTTVEVWDRGPHKRLKRIVDLNLWSFSQLEDPKQGLVEVSVRRIK